MTAAPMPVTDLTAPPPRTGPGG
ncbi:MAG: hypothetical protein QOE53_2858, partial [Pseudonocardiales bacterium]|nr:hypothetical protein [Pseudonocardiales bacterium]